MTMIPVQEPWPREPLRRFLRRERRMRRARRARGEKPPWAMALEIVLLLAWAVAAYLA